MAAMTRFQRLCLWTMGLCAAGVVLLGVDDLVTWKMDRMDRYDRAIRSEGCFPAGGVIYCPGFVCESNGFLSRDQSNRTCVPFDPMRKETCR